VAIIGNVNLVLFELQAAPFDFYLTGSHYFGGVRSDSDWDFFTESRDGLTDFLKSLGFERYAESYADDPQIALVYRHLQGVDVQIVADVQRKLNAQNLIYKSGLLKRGASKQEARMLWKFVYALPQLLVGSLQES